MLVVTISSALSGTNHMMHLIAQEPEQAGMDIRIIDTKSIGAGAGVQAILAAELIAAGDSFDEVVRKVEQSVEESRIYFCLSTLEYLARGGRIGKVSAVLGSLLKIKPIITCNEEGAYAIAARCASAPRPSRRPSTWPCAPPGIMCLAPWRWSTVTLGKKQPMCCAKSKG